MILTSSARGLLPPEGWLFAKNHRREEGLVPANYVASLSTTAPLPRSALRDASPELGNRVTGTWVEELRAAVLREAREAVAAHMRGQTDELLERRAGEREAQLEAELAKLRDEVALREAEHALELQRMRETTLERAQASEEGTRAALLAQLDAARGASERLRARCMHVISARRVIVDRLSVVHSQLERTNDECAKLRQEVLDVQAGEAEGESTIERLVEASERLKRGASSGLLGVSTPAPAGADAASDGEPSIAEEVETMIGVVSAASTLQRGKSGRMDAALVEANEAVEAAHQAKQAAEEALAECVAKLAHLEEAPPKVLAGRILTLKNLKVNNVPDMDVARGKDVSDPFVRIALLDDYGNVIADEVTTHLRNQRNPAWEQELTMPLPPHVTYPPTIVAEVWDKDWYKEDERIGKLKLGLEPLHTGRGRVLDAVVPVKGKKSGKDMLFSCWYEMTPLLYYGSAHEAEKLMRLEGADAPRICPAGRIIKFCNIRANNVPSMDAEGGSDPYCRISLLDDDRKVVDDECTRFLRNTRDPAWKNTLSMPVPTGISFPPTVVVEIWDKDWKQEDERIGILRVELQPDEMGGGMLQGLYMPVEGRNEDEVWEDERMSVSFEYNLTPELYYEEALPSEQYRPATPRE